MGNDGKSLRANKPSLGPLWGWLGVELVYLIWIFWYVGTSIALLLDPGDGDVLIWVLLYGLAGFVVSLFVLAIGSLPLWFLRGKLGWGIILTLVAIPAAGLAAIGIILAILLCGLYA